MLNTLQPKNMNVLEILIELTKEQQRNLDASQKRCRRYRMTILSQTDLIQQLKAENERLKAEASS